ncbi:MAG: Calx-beta domain-containing protein [Isosphaeraceae bacterium]
MRSQQVRRFLLEREVRRRRLALTVERMEARVLLANVTVVSSADDGSVGTLRWAILQVNGDSTPGAIQFNLPGAGVKVIGVLSPLPELTVPVAIDATSQPGYTGWPLVAIDGRLAGKDAAGLVLSAGGSSVRGLCITNFSGAGLILDGGSGSVLQGNFIGVDSSGMTAQPNGDGVAILGSSFNTIGGMTPDSANLLSGNAGHGIRVVRTIQDSAGNLIIGNRVGTTADGVSALGNGASGIQISGATRNVVGGAEPGTGNVVSGNLQNGLELVSAASENTVLGNLIGTSSDGRDVLGNFRNGILLSSASNNSIGGATPGSGNVVSANFGDGIGLFSGSSENLIEGNWIGTESTHTLRLGNRGNGVSLASSDNTVGGLGAGAGNTIAYNGSGLSGAGVQLHGVVARNSILSNAIHDNAGLGINLGSGPTPNHAPGASDGPNNYQNYPVLSTARTDGRVSSLISSLLGIPNSSYTVQFFGSPAGDPSGFGEGRTFLGSYGLDTDGTGNATKTFDLPGLPPNSVISATATDAEGNTSEFSPFVAVRAVTDLAVSIRATPNPVTVGSRLFYTVTVANSGNLEARGVELTDVLPPRAFLVGMTPSQGVASSTNGQTITARLGTIPAGGSATLTVEVQVVDGRGPALSSSASVHSDDIDSNPADNSATVTTLVTAPADLSLSVSSSAATVLLGGTLDWTLTATNRGPADAHHARLSVPLTGFAYVSADAPQGTSSYSDGMLTVDFGTLLAGAQTTVTLQLRAAAVGTFSNIAAITSDEFDPRPYDDQATATVSVLPVTDLGVIIEPDGLKTGTGQAFRVSVRAVNRAADAGGVVLAFVLPTGFSFISAVSDRGDAPTLETATGTITALIGDLPAGGDAHVLVTVRTTAAAGEMLKTEARVSSEGADSDPLDNVAACTISVRDVSELVVTMVPSASLVPIGQALRYDLGVSNLGPADEPDAALVLPLPSGVSLVSATSDTGSAPVIEDGVLRAAIGKMATGRAANISVVVSPGTSLLGLLTLSASVVGENYSIDPGRASASVLVTPSSGVSISVAPRSTPAHEDAVLTYTLTVSNAGPSPAADVLISSPLPAGTSYRSASGDPGIATRFEDGRVWASLNSLGVGQAVQIEVTVIPLGTFIRSELALAGTVIASAFDPDPRDNEASVTVPVAPSNDLAVSLVSSLGPTPLSAGGPFSITAVVVNRGPSPASGVVLRLPLDGAAQFLSGSSTQGTVGLQSGLLEATIGTVAPGTTVIAEFRFVAAAIGPTTWTAAVSGNEYDLDLGSNEAAISLNILESPGSLGFTSAAYEVDESAGFIEIPVIRTLGTRGSVSVRYQTTSVDATAGMDYLPVSGILMFAEGETRKSIRVPILKNPHNSHDEFVGLALDSPGDGAVLATQVSTLIRIRDIDPDFTPPRVMSLEFAGHASAITGLIASFSEPVQVTASQLGVSYQIVDLGTSGRATPASVSPIELLVSIADASGQRISLVPAQPLAAGHFYRITLAGSGISPIRDLAGNPLAGSNGQAGSDYVVLFGRGSNLSYVDQRANLVTFRVTGGGYVDVIRDPSGEGQVMRLVEAVPGSTTLSGTVKRAKGRGVGRTTLDSIEGLGSFGQVRVKLSSPPFTIRHYPFFLNNGRNLSTRGAIAAPRRISTKAAPRPVRPVP